MVKKQKKKNNNLIYQIILIIIIFSLTSILIWFNTFRYVENLIIDSEFKYRKPIKVEKNIATIDIDDLAIESIGRWPWGWDKLKVIIDVADLYNSNSVSFVDIPFNKILPVNMSESKTNLMKQKLSDLIVNYNDKDLLLKALPDITKSFNNKIKNFKNIFMTADFTTLEKNASEKKYKSQILKKSLNHSLERKIALKTYLKKYSLKIENVNIKKIKQSIDIIPPVKTLINIDKGVGHNKVVQDKFGTIRNYPLVLRYKNKIYPSLALLMVLNKFDLDLKDVVYETNKKLTLKLNNNKKMIIPLNEDGTININWTGAYKNTFIHFPFSLIANHYCYFIGKQVLSKFVLRVDNTGNLEIRYLENKDMDIETAQQVDMNTVQSQLYQKLKETGLVSDEVVENNVGLSLFIGWLMDFFSQNGMQYNDFLGQLGLESNDVVKTIWNEIIINNNFINNVLAGDTSITFEKLLNNPMLVKSDTVPYFDTAVLKNSFEQIKHFYNKGLYNSVRPYYFPPPANIHVGKKKYELSLLNLKDKVLFTGLTATGLNSFNPTPYEERYMMLGLTPNVYNSIITTQYLIRTPAWIIFILIFIFTSITIVSTLQLSVKKGAFATIMLLIFYPTTSWLLFNKAGMIQDILPPSFAIFISYIASILFRYLMIQREKKEIRNMFATMVSPEILKMMENNRDDVKMNGQKVEASMFSSDVSGFTTISEGVTAQELANILNIYLTPMSNIIMKYNGYIDKYEGDAIKADFGIPLDDENHHWKCCFASLEQQEELDVIQRMILLKFGVSISARMGVNTGIVSAALLGSAKKMQYSVMGEAVTIAEEMEPINKLFETWIAMGPLTYERAGDKVKSKLLNLVDFDHHGIIPVYEIMGWDKEFYMEYWKDKPISPLILEGLKIMPFEKILGYKYYFNTKKLPDLDMVKYFRNFFNSITDKTVEYMNLQDIVTLTTIKKDLESLIAQIGLFNPDKNDIPEKYSQEYNELKAETEKDKGQWYKQIFELKSEIKMAYNLVTILEVDKSIIENFYAIIDTLEKKVECLFKRVSYSLNNPEDKIPKSLADFLVELLEKWDVIETEYSLEKTDADIKQITTFLRTKLKDFADSLVSRSNEYYEMLSYFCVVSEQDNKINEIYAAARELYLQRKWDESIEKFKEILAIDEHNGPATKFIERIEGYKQNIPDDKWQGEWPGEV